MNWHRTCSVTLLAMVLLSALPDSAVAAVQSIQLFNNTTHSVDIINPQSGRRLDILPPAGRKIFSYRKGITLRTEDGQVLSYPVVPVPREYGRGGLLSLTFNAQLNPDLTISLLPPLTNPPALDPVRQPPGFPLRPNR